MKEHIRFLWGVILSILCFFACTNKQEDIELFLKKEIVKEFANKGIDAKILKNSLKLVSDGEGKFKGSVSVVIDNEVYEHDLSVLIEEESVQWQMEETEASVKKRAQKREELQRQEAQRQEMAQRRQEEAQRREEEMRIEQEETQRREEAAQRREIEHQTRIYQELQRIDEIKSQLPTLFARWMIAVQSNNYNSDVYYLHTINDLIDEADRLYYSLSWDQSIDKQALNKDKRDFHDWCDDMIHRISLARYNY